MKSPANFKAIQAQCLAETIEAYVSASRMVSSSEQERQLLQKLVADTNNYLQFVAKQTPNYRYRVIRGLPMRSTASKKACAYL